MSTESLESLNSSSDEKSPITKCYGWKPPKPDDRDLKLVQKGFFKNPALINFPPKLDLVDMPPIYTQGNLGSCTANAISSAYRYGKQSKKKKSSKILYQADCLSTIMNEC